MGTSCACACNDEKDTADVPTHQVEPAKKKSKDNESNMLSSLKSTLDAANSAADMVKEAKQLEKDISHLQKDPISGALKLGNRKKGKKGKKKGLTTADVKKATKFGKKVTGFFAGSDKGSGDEAEGDEEEGEEEEEGHEEEHEEDQH